MSTSEIITLKAQVRTSIRLRGGSLKPAQDTQILGGWDLNAEVELLGGFLVLPMSTRE